MCLSLIWPCSEQEVGQKASWCPLLNELVEFIFLILMSWTQMRIGGDFHHQSAPAVLMKIVSACALLLSTPRSVMGQRWSILLIDSESSKGQIFLLSTVQYFDLATKGVVCLFVCLIYTFWKPIAYWHNKCLKSVWRKYSIYIQTNNCYLIKGALAESENKDNKTNYESNYWKQFVFYLILLL